MSRMAGKQAFLEILKQEGVSHLFGNPGTTELPLMDGLVREPGIHYVLALQEAVAVAMADGYAQASGGLGVVNLHVAPGLGNGMGMLYDARKSNAPLLVTAGQHDQSFTATEPILWAELPPLAQPFVKWASEIRRIEDLPRLVRRAATTALAHPSGPVFLSLPVDVLNAEHDLELGEPTRVAPRVVGDRAAVDELARLLARAERPIIVTGDAVAQSDALGELVTLAELLGCPVVSEGVASTCSFPFTHPLYGGALPRIAPAIRGVLMRHDVVFAVGADLFTLSLPDEVDPMPPGLTIVQLDTDAWSLGKNYPARVAVLGDPKVTLPEISEAVRRHTTPTGHPQAAARLEALRTLHQRATDDLARRARTEADRSPATALAVVKALGEAAPADTVVVDESISSGTGIRNFFRCADARSFYGLRGGGIGWGLPAALGVKLALPDRPVVALVGDGSTMYTNQALWTAARDSIGVVAVILNNASYRILKQRVMSLKGFTAHDERFVGMDLDQPAVDFVGLARSMGVPGEHVETAAGAASALARGIASGGPYLVDVRIDRALA